MTSYKDSLYRPRIYETIKDYSFLKPTTKQILNYPTEQNHSTYMSAHPTYPRKEDIFKPLLPYEEPAALVDLKVIIWY